MWDLIVSVPDRCLSFYFSESQSGFRENYSTTDNAFILQSLINRYLS